MGFCTRRHFVLTICILQLISTVERQVFDFLGFMWGPILANFFQIIFVIFGFFGTYQYRPKYVIAYSVWSFLWIAWNVFIICFYLNVGILDKNGDALNLGTGSVSWWEVNGAGCRPIYPTNITSEDLLLRPLRPEIVNGCILNYEYVEVLHAALQVLLAFLGGFGGIYVTRILVEEDDSFDFLGGFETKNPQHMALRPTYVRVPTHTSQSHLRSSHLRLSLGRQETQPRSFSLPRNGDSIRMCQSDMFVNKAGITGSGGQKDTYVDYSKAVPPNQRRQIKPRPLSVHVSRFD